MSKEPVAIIGIGCRFPGSVTDAGSYWRLLIDGVDAISEIPPDRWNSQTFYHPDAARAGKIVTRWGGFISQKIDQFDAMFFGISAREAAHLSPMQRWLMETSWEALEDAGIPPPSLAGSDTGVFIGSFIEDMMTLHFSESNRDLIDSQTAAAGSPSILSNRLSYIYDLHGPSMTLDTACSSSLVAVHLAC